MSDVQFVIESNDVSNNEIPNNEIPNKDVSDNEIPNTDTCNADINNKMITAKPICINEDASNKNKIFTSDLDKNNKLAKEKMERMTQMFSEAYENRYNNILIQHCSFPLHPVPVKETLFKRVAKKVGNFMLQMLSMLKNIFYYLILLFIFGKLLYDLVFGFKNSADDYFSNSMTIDRFKSVLAEGKCTITEAAVDIDQKYAKIYFTDFMEEKCEIAGYAYNLYYDVSYEDFITSINDVVGSHITTDIIKHVDPIFSWTTILFGSMMFIFLIRIIMAIFAECNKQANGVVEQVKAAQGTIAGVNNMCFITYPNVDTTFSDVIGLKEAKEEIMKVAHMIKNSEKYMEIGAKLPKGVLLTGPPGCGKTLLARALAGETKTAFIAVNAAEFDEKLVGVGASRVKQMFEAAKKEARKSPSGGCIIFIDEIDAIGKKRSLDFSGESSQTLNMILTELDGFGKDSSIMVLAATNMAELLDPALTRSGRFDHKIHIDPPTKEDRIELFKFYLSKLKLEPDVTTISNITYIPDNTVPDKIESSNTECNNTECNTDSTNTDSINTESSNTKKILEKTLDEVFTETSNTDTNTTPVSVSVCMPLPVSAPTGNTVCSNSDSDSNSDSNSNKTKIAEELAREFTKYTTGMTGADIQNVCNQAAISAVSKGLDIVTKTDLISAIDTIQIGLKKDSRKASLDYLKTISYHESGHALLGLCLEDSEDPIRMTIVPRGEGNLGYTMQGISETGIHTRENIICKMIVLLGGRMAERQVFKNITTGAGDDLLKLNNYAKDYFLSGLSDSFPNIYIPKDLKDMSNEFKVSLENRIMSLITNLTEITKRILEHHEDELTVLSEALLEYEIIDFTNLSEDLSEKIKSVLSIRNSIKIEISNDVCDFTHIL